MNIISIIFWLLLADAFIAVMIAFSTSPESLMKKIPSLRTLLPNARRWALMYLALVCVLGGILTHFSLLTTFW